VDGHSVLAELEKELADPNTSEVRWDQAPLGDLLIHILASYALPHDGVHGLRGGEFAKALYNSGTLELSPDQFALLDEWAGGSSSLALELLS
jgi:hypothetical protein